MHDIGQDTDIDAPFFGKTARLKGGGEPLLDDGRGSFLGRDFRGHHTERVASPLHHALRHGELVPIHGAANIFAREFLDIGFEAFAFGGFDGFGHACAAFVVIAQLIPNEPGVNETNAVYQGKHHLVPFLTWVFEKLGQGPLVHEAIEKMQKCSFFHDRQHIATNVVILGRVFARCYVPPRVKFTVDEQSRPRVDGSCCCSKLGGRGSVKSRSADTRNVHPDVKGVAHGGFFVGIRLLNVHQVHDIGQDTDIDAPFFGKAARLKGGGEPLLDDGRGSFLGRDVRGHSRERVPFSLLRLRTFSFDVRLPLGPRGCLA